MVGISYNMSKMPGDYWVAYCMEVEGHVSLNRDTSGNYRICLALVLTGLGSRHLEVDLFSIMVHKTGT